MALEWDPLGEMLDTSLITKLDEYLCWMRACFEGYILFALFSRQGDECRVRVGKWGVNVLLLPKNAVAKAWFDYEPKLAVDKAISEKQFRALLDEAVKRGVLKIAAPVKATSTNNASDGIAAKCRVADGRVVEHHYFVQGALHEDDPRHDAVCDLLLKRERAIGWS